MKLNAFRFRADKAAALLTASRRKMLQLLYGEECSLDYAFEFVAVENSQHFSERCQETAEGLIHSALGNVVGHHAPDKAGKLTCNSSFGNISRLIVVNVMDILSA